MLRIRSVARSLGVLWAAIALCVFAAPASGAMYVHAGTSLGFMGTTHLDLAGDTTSVRDDLGLNITGYPTLNYPSDGSCGYCVYIGRPYGNQSTVAVAASSVYPMGQPIDAGLSYATSEISMAAHNYNGTTGAMSNSGVWANQAGYIGLTCVLDGQTHYGWAQIKEEVIEGPPLPYPRLTIVQWGLQLAPDTPVLAGQLVGTLRDGDADMNGIVNFKDYIIVERYFGRTSGMNWANGDFNGDGAVTFKDYVRLEGIFGQSSVPEPATLSLLALAGLAMAKRRK